MQKLARLTLTFALSLGLAASASAQGKGKNKPADGAGSDSDHIPVKMQLRDAGTDGILSDGGGDYVHEVDNVLCDLNTPGSLICNSTDFKRREGIRKLTFTNLPGGIGTVAVPFRMTTTFCQVRDLEEGFPDDDRCNLNFRFEVLGETYNLRFDPSATDGSSSATRVIAHCTAPENAETGQCTNFKITTDGVTDPHAVLYKPGKGNSVELIGIFPYQIELYAEILP